MSLSGNDWFWRRVSVVCLSLISLAVGCVKSASPPENSPKNIGSSVSSGTAKVAGSPVVDGAAERLINIEGSSTVYLISQAFVNEFEKIETHKVSLGRSGTGGGYKKFVLRQADIWNASRPIAQKEIDEL